jgi:hypothetical protein
MSGYNEIYVVYELRQGGVVHVVAEVGSKEEARELAAEYNGKTLGQSSFGWSSSRSAEASLAWPK